jgi:mRNA interferase MazF
MGYIPEQGDIVFLEFNPQAGHEQRGKRPALVVSNRTFNHFTNLAMVCPITNTSRAFPLHVELGPGMKTTGVILCEQVKSLDLRTRNAAFFEKAPRGVLNEVLDILFGCLEVEENFSK